MQLGWCAVEACSCGRVPRRRRKARCASPGMKRNCRLLRLLLASTLAKQWHTRCQQASGSNAPMRRGPSAAAASPCSAAGTPASSTSRTLQLLPPPLPSAPPSAGGRSARVRRARPPARRKVRAQPAVGAPASSGVAEASRQPARPQVMSSRSHCRVGVECQSGNWRNDRCESFYKPPGRRQRPAGPTAGWGCKFVI